MRAALPPPAENGPRGLALAIATLTAFFAVAGLGADDWRAWESAKIRLHVARMTCYERSYLAGPGREAALAAERKQITGSLERLGGARRPPPRRGLLLEAYISANDDSPQPFWRYLPCSSAVTGAPPLLIFLHGYDPWMDIASAPGIPGLLTNLAERVGACIAAPFGRGNTDYQTIGEQDVLRVLDEMSRRHGIDRRRVVLAGLSMGGLGVWCVGARWADRFNMLLAICGRADFYVWHRLAPRDLPPWQRELVDTQFATRYLDRLAGTLTVAAHGRYDSVVTYEQGVFPALTLSRLGGTRCNWIEFPFAEHDVFYLSLEHPRVQALLREGLTRVFPKPRKRRLAVPGASGSRLQDAFLEPFMFVAGDDDGSGGNIAYLEQRAAEWQRFAHARPRMALEEELDLREAAARHLFIFGEPEHSRLARAVLERGGAVCAADSFTIAGRRLPRAGHGLWFTGRNPFNTNLTAVVQCGLPWGQGLADNHRYDRLPDVIVYNEDSDRFGCNVAVAAGFLDASRGVRWSDPPFTEAIRRPPAVMWDY